MKGLNFRLFQFVVNMDIEGRKNAWYYLKTPEVQNFLMETLNAIVTFNLWREHRLIETDPKRPREFRLVNMDQDQLLQIQ